MYTIIYDFNGNFQCILRANADGSQTSFGPGSPPWAEYVAQKGVPPPTGTPAYKPSRIPRPPAAIAADINTLSQGDQTKLFNAWRLSSVAQFMIDYPQFAMQLGINVSGDQANT